MKHAVMAILILTFCAGCLVAQPDSADGGAGIIYGDKHAFGIAAPPGWVLDNQSGLEQGLQAVFYPRGSSWEGSPVVMYANTVRRDISGKETLDSLIKADIADFKARHPGVVVGALTPMITGNGKPVPVRTFSYKRYEAVAYIEEEFILAMLVLSAGKQEEYTKALPAFEHLVASYHFLTTGVSWPDK